MKDHALIGKFLGLWSLEKDLVWWIDTWWKPKGHYDLKLASKGYFAIVFYNVEDVDWIFKNGPYFFNSVSLHLKFWIEYSAKKNIFHICPNLDMSLLIAPGLLARRNLGGHRQYIGDLCQSCKSYEKRLLYFICKNMCLHEYLPTSPKLYLFGLSRYEMGSNHWLWTHPV